MKEEFNTNRLIRQVKQIKYFSLFFITLLLGSNAYFAFMWHKEVSSEVTYFVSPEATYPAFAERKRALRTRHLWEVENFSEQFISRALVHSSDTYDENLEHLLGMMDQQSRYRILKQFMDNDFESVFKTHGAVSEVKIERILINMDKMPYDVLVVYELTMNYVGEQSLEKRPTRLAMYFRTQTVPRSKHNPYGLRAINVKFVDPPEEKNQSSIS